MSLYSCAEEEADAANCRAQVETMKRDAFDLATHYDRAEFESLRVSGYRQAAGETKVALRNRAIAESFRRAKLRIDALIKAHFKKWPDK